VIGFSPRQRVVEVINAAALLPQPVLLFLTTCEVSQKSTCGINAEKWTPKALGKPWLATQTARAGQLPCAPHKPQEEVDVLMNATLLCSFNEWLRKRQASYMSCHGQGL